MERRYAHGMLGVVLLACTPESPPARDTAPPPDACTTNVYDGTYELGVCFLDEPLATFCSRHALVPPEVWDDDGCPPYATVLADIGFFDDDPRTAWDGSTLGLYRCEPPDGPATDTFELTRQGGTFSIGAMFDVTTGALLYGGEGLAGGDDLDPYCCGTDRSAAASSDRGGKCAVATPDTASASAGRPRCTASTSAFSALSPHRQRLRAG
ncbi:MAG: hypothetical protein ACI8PZ_000462 [Myxococcota bacterium]